MLKRRWRERGGHCVSANRKVCLVEPSVIRGHSLVAVIADEMNFRVRDTGRELVLDDPLYVEGLTWSNPTAGLPKGNSVEHQSANGQE